MSIIAPGGLPAQGLPTSATISVDTEFHDTQTLSIQTAMRLDADRLAVQLYRAADVPELPAAFALDQYLATTADRYGLYCRQVVVRPVKVITPDLSPALVLRDLLGLSDIQIHWRSEGMALIEGFEKTLTVPTNVHWDKRSGGWQVPPVGVTLVGHFLRADFNRLFGRKLLEDLLPSHLGDRRGVRVRCRKLIEFVEQTGSRTRTDAVLEYLSKDNRFYEVRVRMRDTMFPFGPASLADHSKTFLGLGKSEVLSEEEKKDMRATFQRRTADAYGYAVVDAVNTLLVHERMQEQDRAIYQAFGFDPGMTPPLRPTLGSRLSTFLLRTTTQALQSKSLPSERAVEALMQKGGIKLFKQHPDASKFGLQTGTTHGGLLYSRSPTRFWHASAGKLRDVDMSGCYNNIIAQMDLYWGRPVVFEPGNAAWTLNQAVAFAQEHAADHGWLVRVTGAIQKFPNALIPSTDGALTSANYRQKLRSGKRRKQRQRIFHLESLRDPDSVEGTRSSRPYAARVDSGIVTAKTWLMIQALPAAWRAEYEGLIVDSLIFYPRKLIAEDGAHFDALSNQYANDNLPWETTLDLGDMEMVQKQCIDAQFIALRYPIGEFGRKIGQLRRQAQQIEGKGSGADLAWKMHANSMYGVLASSHLATNNFVGANQITAWARAEAFALSQALNAIQTITDGCTYRLDQLPAIPYAECLRIKPDYPIRRAEEGDGIPFLDPATIPTDDAEFTEWYRRHVMWFFGAHGADYAAFFATHTLDHKKTGGTQSVAFDALGCDGAGNYVKCLRDANGNWHVKDFAARSYRRTSKETLRDWLVDTYANDRLVEPGPVTEDTELLSFSKAGQRARAALDQGATRVYFPLGLASGKVQAYRIIKPSAFIFQTPEQRAALVKQIQQFEEKNGTGLELLALRRSYRGRRRGSLCALADQLYSLIRAGRTKLEDLNANKMNAMLKELAQERVEEIEGKKLRAERGLFDRIDARNMNVDALPTGFLLTSDDVWVFEGDD